MITPPIAPDPTRLDAWVSSGLRVEPRSEVLTHDGIAIHHRIWESGSATGGLVVLVHGGGAHARWWDHTAPGLAVSSTVVAIDLSGHWPDDVIAVARAVRGDVQPVVVGASPGGLVATAAALTRPDAVRGDKADSSRAIRSHLRARRITAHIPEPDDHKGHRKRRGSAGDRPPDLSTPRPTRGRNVVERRYCHTKHCHTKQRRGLATATTRTH